MLGVLLAAALTVVFALLVRWEDTWRALSEVQVGWVAVAAALLLGEHVVRAFRWRVLLAPVDPEAPIGAVLSATLIGGALNVLLPLRGGDLVRPLVLARKRGKPVAAVLSSTVVEKVLDVGGLLGVVTLTLFALSERQIADPTVLATIRSAGVLLALALASLLAVAVSLAFAGARGLFSKGVSWMPERVSTRAMRLFDELATGVSALRHPGRAAAAIGLTAIVWGNGLLALLVMFRAFHQDLPVSVALFAQCALAGVAAIPQAPGYWGTFQAALGSALEIGGGKAGFSEAGALVFWAVSFVPVTLAGLIESWRTGLSPRRLREEVARD